MGRLRKLATIFIASLAVVALPASGGAGLEDSTPPDIVCDAADGSWHSADATISCTASDADPGLADLQDAAFDLTTSVAAGVETANASTNSHDVCDAEMNCATAGPIGGNMVDKKAPVVNCSAVDGSWHASNVSIDCASSDGGSGLADANQANVNLVTSVPSGAETANAATNSVSICDDVGNCSSAGPVGGNKIDRRAPHNPTTVRSTDHKLHKWTRDRTIAMTWRGASDGGSRLDGFSFSWNHRARSVPDARKDREQRTHKATSSKLRTGKWWFHLRTRDNVGNWSGAVDRGPYLIDVTRPHVRARSASGKVGHRLTLRYQTSDNTDRTREHLTVSHGGSVVKSWSTRMGRAFFGTIQKVAFTPHASGSYSFCVEAWDPAGNTRRDCAGVNVKAPPPPPGGGGGGTNCDNAYPSLCLHDGIGDYDCAGGGGDGPNYVHETNFPVRSPDPFDLDGNGNGVGCET
jgi:hypothetical protein